MILSKGREKDSSPVCPPCASRDNQANPVPMVSPVDNRWNDTGRWEMLSIPMANADGWSGIRTPQNLHANIDS